MANPAPHEQIKQLRQRHDELVLALSTETRPDELDSLSHELESVLSRIKEHKATE